MVTVVRVHDGGHRHKQEAEGELKQRKPFKFPSSLPVTYFLPKQLPTGDLVFRGLGLRKDISVKPLQTPTKILTSYFVAVSEFIRRVTRPRIDNMI